jgi:hypothetical protein
MERAALVERIVVTKNEKGLTWKAIVNVVVHHGFP